MIQNIYFIIRHLASTFKKSEFKSLSENTKKNLISSVVLNKNQTKSNEKIQEKKLKKQSNMI